MKEILLSGKGIRKDFSEKRQKEQILKNIDVDIYAGDFTVVMGPSGAGKSTLLYALSGMDNITDGKVLYQGKEINGYTERQMAVLRSREFGFVFQQTHLVSNLTLFENVAVAGYLNAGKDAKEVRKRADELLSQMRVETARDRLPSEVSGGEAQRAAIARAVINNPSLIFADEPRPANTVDNRTSGSIIRDYEMRHKKLRHPLPGRQRRINGIYPSLPCRRKRLDFIEEGYRVLSSRHLGRRAREEHKHKAPEKLQNFNHDASLSVNLLCHHTFPIVRTN